MRVALAWASLRRHPVRTGLAVLGVAVSAAMLLDMVMLASGMQVSFKALLVRNGFDMRLAPRGTLPFDTEARMRGAAAAESALSAIAGVRAVSPVLGTTLHVLPPTGASIPVFALGLRPPVQGDYEVVEGADADALDRVVVNDDLLAATGMRIGDSLDVAGGYDAQVRTWTSRRRLAIAGRGHFFYLARGQRALAMPLGALQHLAGRATEDRVSLFMLAFAPGVDGAALQPAIERAVPQATAIATADAVRSVEERLTYFRQLALILGSVSLVVGFLLVATLVTVGVQERLGEIAVMRAIGVSRPHVAGQVMLEALAISGAGAGLGLLLGLGTARYLNAILRAFPGLPAAIDFFVFQAADAWQALGMLLLTAVAAGLVPSWRAASLTIARTLREEAVG
jgi:putative ABC transport system permease protein